MTACPALKIASGGITAEVAPFLGGALLSLGDGAGPLLRMGTADAVAADPRASACFPCAPWFGRLGLSFDAFGRKAALRPTLAAASPMSLHGDGWVSAWEMSAHADDQLSCRLPAARSLSGFPFAYEVEQQFRIMNGGLQIDLSLRNADKVPMPAGLGLHPYFHRTQTTRLAFSSTGYWTPPERNEKGFLTALPSALGAGAPASLPDEPLDHSFTGFGGSAMIFDDHGGVRLASNAPILHLYAPAGEAFFCLEPVTHLPGAFLDSRGHMGGRVLAPGMSQSLKLVIDRPD